MKYIKGFDKYLCCRGFQFEIGKTYATGANDDELKLCSDTVFHFCESLQQVHGFYNVRKNNRYCEIEALGKVVNDEKKCGSNKIRVVREIVGNELDTLLLKINGNIGIFNSGDGNSGDGNSGNRNSGYWNSGNYNSGNRNSGYWNSGNYNSGHRNSGHGNSGHGNSGNYNSGNRNSGDGNSGNYNSGHRNSGHGNSGHGNSGHGNSGDGNSGDGNSGNYNSGHWNSCNQSSGLFNTKKQTVFIFNKDSGLTYEQCINTKWFNTLFNHSFNLTEWIDYTEEEMKESPIRQAIRGYIKTYTYKDACQNWWNKYNEKEKEIILSIPNFDKNVFKEITGIEVS